MGRVKLILPIALLIFSTFVVFPSTAKAADPDNTVRVHRFYNKLTNTHFYTASMEEAAHVFKNMQATYRYEGVAFHAYHKDSGNGIRIHRFYNNSSNTHFYTSSEQEATLVYNMHSSYKGNTYKIFRYEGIAYRSDNSYPMDGLTRTGLHRFYKWPQNTHFYTASQAEATHVYNTMYPAYRYEGEKFVVIASTASTAASQAPFANCTDASAAGAAPVLIGDTGYASHLDSDTDGIGCEAG